ncbi:iron-containing alcohol dehydrogenase [Erysipelotrichaceae bacterium RD49]|nr:iron-containing alcohol dehydrogenase [Erysipelotrichaceae bacterium RD49]
MQDFQYSYPVRVYFGKQSLAQALNVESAKMGETVMLVYGGGSIKRNGIYDEVVELLQKNGKKIVEFDGVMSNPTYAKVQEGAKLVKDEKVDFILAVGGGSVSDASKIISAQAKLNEGIWEMEMEKHQFPTEGIPMGVVVTASGTGSEMNNGAVITHEDKKIKAGVLGTLPSFAVLNPEFTMTVPESQVFSGAFDTLSHAMETYFGNSDQDNVSDDVALAIMKNTVKNMHRLVKDVNDQEARSNLMWDSAMAENGILKCGRKTDFQAHQIEHQLGAYTDCNHGQGLAVIHPVYYKHIVQDAPEKFERFAEEVFGVESVQEGLDALEDFIQECHLPTKLSQLRSVTPITPELLRKVADSSNLIQTGPRPLTHDEIYDILMECLD